MTLVRWAWSLSTNAAVALIGAIGLLCLIASPLAVVAAISVIGIPLAIAMAAIPTLALAVVTWRLAYLALSAAGLRSLVASAIVAGLALAVPPAVYNARLDARAQQLVAGDIPAASPLPPGTAVGQRHAFATRPVSCDDLCRRLLLSGVASRVVVAENAFTPEAPARTERAVAFRLATTGQTCPDMKDRIPFGVALRLPGEPATVDTGALIRIAQVAGRCLLAEPATLGEAAVVIGHGPVARGGNAYAAGLSPGYDTIRAHRLSVHVERAGRFEETHRTTRLVFDRLVPILAPTYAFGGELRSVPALLRTQRSLNATGRDGIEPDWAAVTRDTLKIDLSMGAQIASSSPGRALGDAVAAGKPLSPAAAGLATDLFAQFARQQSVTPADAQVALAVLRDRSVPVSHQAWSLVRYGRSLPAETLNEVADLLFARLRELGGGTDRSQRALQAAQPIAAAIGALPESILRAHRTDLEWLAGDVALRVPAYTALFNLSLFGAESVPTLLALVEAGTERRKRDKGAFDEWQHPYLAGLIGLCRAGPSAASAAPTLLQWVERGDVLSGASYGRLATHTLLAVGASPDAVAQAFATTPAKPEEVARNIKNAQRRQDCSY